MTDLSYIAESLRPLAVPIDSLHEDPANARVGHDVARIAASLERWHLMTSEMPERKSPAQ